MRDENGHLVGDAVISEPLVLWGSIAGNVRAVKGSKFYLRGVIYGNLDVEPGGRVHIFGSISGNLSVAEKSKVILSGMVAGDVVNNGGRLYIESSAKVMGQLKADVGETKIEKRRD